MQHECKSIFKCFISIVFIFYFLKTGNKSEKEKLEKKRKEKKKLMGVTKSKGVIQSCPFKKKTKN
jgi:hypothetical protein